MAGIIGTGRAERLLDLDLTVLLAFVEAIVCESQENAEHVQQIYDRAKPAPPVHVGDVRRAEVASFLTLVG